MDPFDLPQDLSTLSADDLAAALTAAAAERDRLFGLDTPTPADVARAEKGLGVIAALEGEQTARTGAVDAMAALRERSTTAAAEDAEGQDGAEDEDGEGDEDADADAEAEADAESDAAVEEAAADTDAAKDKAVVAAGRKPTARQRLAGRKPATGPSSRQTTAVITAAAKVRGYEAGQTLAIEELVDAVEQTMRSFPTFSGGTRNPAVPEGTMDLRRFPTAVIRRDFGEDWADGSSKDLELLEKVSKESTLKGGSLVAAGGWCAPSETLYDLCGGETTDGLIDLPEIGVKRGGIKYTAGPDFATLYAQGFTQTEAQNIAATTKPCYTVPCPSFTETRLDAMGMCVKAGLLQDAAWPELTRRVISGVLVAHQHRISAALITKMVAASSANVNMTNTGSVASNALDSVAILAETLRELYRLQRNQTMEVVAPVWLREAIRADLAMRTGAENLLSVTDQQIDQFFAIRKARVQWVYNWQQLASGEEGYPATAQVMVYPAGTFVRGSADIITLDSVYDAASLSVNDYTALFTEEGVLLAQRCYQSRLATIQVGVTGRTGAHDVTQATPTAGSFTLV